MNFGHHEVECVEVGALIEDLFGIDAAALAAMAPPPHKHDNDPALLGLQEFLRRVFVQISQLRDSDSETLSITGDSPFGAWPDARTARLANLMVAARVNEWRPYRRLPFLALEEDGASVPAQRSSLDERSVAMSIGEVIKALRGLPEPMHPRRTFSPRYPLSVVASIGDLLRVNPLDLAARFFDREDRIVDAYAVEPERPAQLGLAHLIGDAIYQYKVMRERDFDGAIRLMSEEDARIAYRPNARIANMITVLSAAIHADNEHVIAFEPAKAPLANEEELLRAAATLVYLDHSREAQDALQRLCDRNIFFGSFDRFPRSQELLAAVREACDPEMQRMPFPVAVLEAGFDAFTAVGTVRRS